MSATVRRIAEWCGWGCRAESRLERNGLRTYGYRIYKPDGSLAGRPEDLWIDEQTAWQQDGPDYASRDACAEFEGLLRERRRHHVWSAELVKILCRAAGIRRNMLSDYAVATATAGQRCAAMGKVLDGEVERHG